MEQMLQAVGRFGKSSDADGPPAARPKPSASEAADSAGRTTEDQPPTTTDQGPTTTDQPSSDDTLAARLRKRRNL